MTYYERGLEGFDPRIGGLADGSKGLSRPDEMPTKEECDCVASNYKQLTKFVKQDDVTIWLDENAGEILYKGPKDIWFGENVTIVGQYCDPNYPGIGTVIKQDYYHRNLFLSAYGEAPTLWGVPLIGPILGDTFLAQEREIRFEDVYFDPNVRNEGRDLKNSDWYASGLFCYDTDSKLFAYGCLFAGWSMAGLEIGSKNVETEAEIKRCTFLFNAMETLGYGCELYNGHQWFDLCYFEGNRHGLAAYGYKTHSYDVTRSVSGPDEVAGHVLDMHDYVPPNHGGEEVRIRACSNLTTHDINGREQEFFAQRGVAEKIDKVWHCATVHEEPPEEPGDHGDFVRQETPSQRDKWENFKLGKNHYGAAHHLDYGAPLSDEKRKELERKRFPQTLRVTCTGGPTQFRIAVDGRAKKAANTEKREKIRKLDNGHRVISGSIGGGVDTFLLDDGVEVIGAFRNGPLTVELDGERLDENDLLAAYLWNYHDRL